MALGGTKGGARQVFGEINITPLTDIFLVLLIIMMVVAPMMDQSRADIKPPQLSSGGDIDPGKLTVEVTRDGTFYVSGEETPEASLVEVFRQRKGDLEEANVVIRADKATKSRAVMAVFAAARDAEYEKVTVAGQPLSGERQQRLHQETVPPTGSPSTMEEPGS